MKFVQYEDIASDTLKSSSVHGTPSCDFNVWKTYSISQACFDPISLAGIGPTMAPGFTAGTCSKWYSNTGEFPVLRCMSIHFHVAEAMKSSPARACAESTASGSEVAGYNFKNSSAWSPKRACACSAKL